MADNDSDPRNKNASLRAHEPSQLIQQNIFPAHLLLLQQQQQQQKGQRQQHQQQAILAQSLGTTPVSVSSAVFGSNPLEALRSTLLELAALEKANAKLALSQTIEPSLDRTSRLEKPSDRAAGVLFQQGAQNQSVQRRKSSRESPYFDASQLPDPSSDDDDDHVDTESEHDEKQGSASKTIGELSEKFPMRLFRMLDEAEKNGDDRIVSFFSHGRAFAVHRPREFVTDLMPKYFSTTRISSFQRQLNLYGFQRIQKGQEKGGYFHELFIRGRRGLCKNIRRKKSKRREIEVAPTKSPADAAPAAAAPSSSSVATASINNPILTASTSVINQLLLNQSNQQLLSEQLRQQQLAALALKQQILQSSNNLPAIPANLNLRMNLGSNLGGSLLPGLSSLTQQNNTTSEALKLAAIMELLGNRPQNR